MMSISLFVVTLLCLATAMDIRVVKAQKEERSFTVDHENNTFLLDGKPFRYISGSFHYFRALPDAWTARLKTMRSAGLNAIDTYVEWSLHNPYDGTYNWEGIANVERFIELARDEGFYVILRPGPYICAERDNGGLPHWLFTKYPNIKLRTSDANYIKEVGIWYDALFTRLQKYLYGNGGSIIMVQVENEYGAYQACDQVYLNWLRDETEKHVQGKALLFTTDIPDERIQCGKIEGVFATTDFGIDRIHEIDDIWKRLRTVQPTGPLVNSEFYPGWLTHWQEQNQRRDGKLVADSLKIMLDYGASVNFYMFFGGTNFGFTAGANDWGTGSYMADITSYDYDAVMTEAGEITPKFELVRNVIAKYEKLPNHYTMVSEETPRMSYGEVQMMPIASLLSGKGREMLTKGTPVSSESPKTFEQLNQYSGLILYETTLPDLEIDPTLLTVNNLCDRALIYVDEQYVGTLSRENRIYSLPLNKGLGAKLQILVENQGRINFNVANDTKGILGNVTIQKLDGSAQMLTNWVSTSMPLDESQVTKLVETNKENFLKEYAKYTSLLKGPLVYYGEFHVSRIGHTYMNTVGWGKGVVYVNGFNLGRYWPLAGPQLTVYVPKELLKSGFNSIVLIEYQRANLKSNSTLPVINLDGTPQLDG